LKEYLYNEPTKKRIIISESNKDTYSCRTMKYKYIYNHRNKKMELYDLDSDPLEHNNIVTENKETLETLRWVIDRHMKDVERINALFFKSLESNK